MELNPTLKIGHYLVVCIDLVEDESPLVNTVMKISAL
jgi:hypothetical protein